MTSRKNIVLAVVVIGMLGCLAAAVQAEAVVAYRLTADGLETGTGAGGAITLGDLGMGSGGGTFMLGIEAMVTGVDLGGSPLGILQYSATLTEPTADGLLPTEDVVFGSPQGTWTSTSTAPIVNYKGTVGAGAGAADVLGQNGAVPPGDWPTYLYEAGGGANYGANRWDLVGSGEFTWDGTITQLDLASLATSNLVGADGSGGGPWGAYPDVVIGDSILFGEGGSGTPPTAAFTSGDNVVDVTVNGADTAMFDDTSTLADSILWEIQDFGGVMQPFGGAASLMVDAAVLNALGYPTPALGDPSTFVDMQLTATNGDGFDIAGGQIEFIPEPSSVIMLLSGLVGLALSWWRRR